MARVRITGLSEMITQMNNQQKLLETNIKREVVSSAYKVHSDAISTLSTNDKVDTGGLRQSGLVEVKESGLRAVITFNAFHAPFVEFGTGTKVDIPLGYEKMAQEFKGKKSGTFADFEEIIEGWMTRKGIDLAYKHLIILKILRVGISPSPFLIPNFQKEAPLFILRVKQLLSKNVRI